MLVKNLLIASLFLAGLLSSAIVHAKNTRLTDEQVKQQIIEQSIASWPGTCACPFNTARNGSSCGRRSAWSKAGGYGPTCYKKEVTKEMVAQWRQSNNAE